MYRNQQHHYSQEQSYNPPPQRQIQQLQPESTLFEDSPTTPIKYDNEIISKQNSYQNRNLEHNHPQQKININNNYNRLIQSEESGGIIMTSDGNDNMKNDNIDDDDEEREGENDIEYIIMNLYSKMKNLEGKYIDLANFYKQELVKTSSTKRPIEDEIRYTNQQFLGNQHQQIQQQLRTGITPSKSFDKSQEIHMDQSPGNLSSNRGGDMHSEREIIRDLIEEKKKFEDDVKQVIQMRSSQYYQGQQSPPKPQLGSYQSNSNTIEQKQLMKDQLQEALSSILNDLDETQKTGLQVLTQKQNEMYTLSNRYNLPSTIRNESLGLWYDAKTKISSLLADFKISIQKKQLDSEVQQPQKNNVKIQNQNWMEKQINNQGEFDEINKKVFENFLNEINQFKNKQERNQKQLQNILNQIRFKEGIVIDEQNKVQTQIKDIMNDFSNIEINRRREQLMMSGDKNQNLNMLSPFEKRIATYQKSAEMRKQNDNLNRSGSRGRPIYQNQNNGNQLYQQKDYVNPQITNVQNAEQNEQEIRYTKSKIRNLEYILESINSKINQKQKEDQELDNVIDKNNNDQKRFLQTLEQIYVQQLQKGDDQHSKNQRSKSKGPNGRQENRYITTSPGSQIENNPTYYSGQRQQLQEKKIGELQRNNDQLFIELRKANEKYLNQRVDNNKLKDEIQILQAALEESHSQMKKQQQLQTIEQPNSQKFQIKKKVASSQRQQDQYFQQQSQTVNPGKQHQGNNLQILQRENDDLKKRIQDLEKECFTLTYYQQEMQRRGAVNSNNDPFIRNLSSENSEMKGRIDQLCIQVQRFLLSMKRLQRAVNNKDKDIQIYKTEFEQNKKSLELLVKETKESQENKIQSQNQMNSIQGIPGYKPQNFSMYGDGQVQNPNHHSMITSWDQREQRFGEQQQNNRGSIGQRNRSLAPQATGQLNRTYNNQNPQQQQQINQIQSITQRNDNSVEDLNYNQGLNQNKKGIIRPKVNMQSMPKQTYQGFNDVSSIEQEQIQNQTSQGDLMSPKQEHQFNKLVEDIKFVQEENENQKIIIQDLKVINENIMADKNGLEIKFNSKSINLQKSTQQLKVASDKIQRQELLLNDYKEAFIQIEQNPNLSKYQVNKIKTELLMRERDQIHQEMTQQDSQRSLNDQQNNQQQQQIYDQKLQNQIFQSQLQQIKEQLTQKIQQKEYELEQQFQILVDKLNQKEEDVEHIKKLFFEKLKEIESSFVEISQEINENDQIQQEASKRFQLQNQSQLQQNKTNELEKSIEQVIGKYEEDQREEELQKLTDANEELIETNSQLTKRIKELEKQNNSQQKYKQLQQQFEIMTQEHESLNQKLYSLQEDEKKKQKIIDNLNQVQKKQQSQISEQNNIREKVEINYQRQLNELEEQLQEAKYELQQEQERRVLFESEFNIKDKQLKTIKSEQKSMENENQQLKQREQSLLAQIESLYQEKNYMTTLKNNDKYDEKQDDKEEKFIDDIENAKIEANPKESANSYLRMLKATNKEHQILVKNHDKLSAKFMEEKEKYNELKLESRQNIEQILNMETRIFDLENENEKLTNQLNKIKGDYKVDEDSIRKQIVEEYKNKIVFKDAEMESTNIKLERISQMNIDLTSRNQRLESNNQEILQENQEFKTKISSLEMELEMTKLNSDRDTDKLLEQQKQQAQMEKIMYESDKAKKEVVLNEKLKLIEQERSQLQEKIIKKKEKMNNLKTEKDQLSQKQKQNGFMSEQIKKSLEQKLKEMQKQIEEEKVTRDEIDKQRQKQIQQQEQERIQLQQIQEKEKLEIEQKFQSQLEQEKNKHINVEKLKQQREKELAERHKQELQNLEKQLQDERYQQEHSLKASEQQKIEQIKKNLEQEKQRLLAQKEQEKNQLLEQQQQQLEQERQEIAEQHENEIKKLQQIKNQEMDLILNNLKKNEQEIDKKQKKQMSLIQVLQNKARQVILKELEDEKIQRQQDKLKAKQELDKLISDQQKLIDQIEKEQQDQLNVIQKNLEKQKQQELLTKDKEKSLALKQQDKIKEDLQNQIEIKQKNHEDEIEKKKQELQKMKKEQDELIKGLTQQQDQQTQNLLEQKDRDIEDLIKKVNEEQKKHQKELNLKNNQIIEFKQDYENQIKDLEQQIEENLQEHKQEINKLNLQIKELNNYKDRIQKNKEQELQFAKEEHSKLVEELQQQNQSELESLKQNLQSQHSSQIKSKEKASSLFEKMQEKIREELKTQVENKEKENKEKEKQINLLEKEITTKEKDFERERIDQQELIDQMNLSMKSIGEQKIQLERENDKIKKEYDILKKQSNESENSLVKDLRDKLQQKEKQYDDLIIEKKNKDAEIISLKSQLKAKETDIQNLEKDLDQFGKDMDEESVIKEKINDQLAKTQNEKQQLEKEKKEVDMKMKLKEALLKQIQDQLDQQTSQIQDKQKQLDEINVRSNQKNEIEKKIEELSQKHQGEISKLEQQNKKLQTQLKEVMSGKDNHNNLNQSVIEIEQKIGNFEIEIEKFKDLNKQLEKLKQLNNSLLDNVNNDKQEEIIGDIGSNKLQYCKRVKYLDKAWILVQKNETYYWIDQAQIPINKFQKINVESLEDTQGILQDKLNELVQSKESILLKLQGETQSNSNRQQNINYLESENSDLKSQLNELQLQNNNLQQSNLQLKSRIKELNDMVFGLTDTEQSHDNIKKIIDLHQKNEQLTQKLIVQYDISRKTEEELEQKKNELEQLKKQLQELEYSFAIGGRNSLAKPENFPLETSSIIQKGDDDDDEESNIPGSIQVQMKRLETEMEEYQKLNNDLENQNRSLKSEIKELKSVHSTAGAQQTHEAEIQDQLKHTRSILIKFLEKVPITVKENEDLLPIIYSMMLFTKDEMSILQKVRQSTADQQLKQATKKGMFAMFKKDGQK